MNAKSADPPRTSTAEGDDSITSDAGISVQVFLRTQILKVKFEDRCSGKGTKIVSSVAGFETASEFEFAALAAIAESGSPAATADFYNRENIYLVNSIPYTLSILTVFKPWISSFIHN